MAYDRYVDDFCITKGDSVYTGNFTPSEKTYSGGGTSGYSTLTPSGNQNSGITIDIAELPSEVQDISKGDFTIELRYRVDSIFEMYGGEPDLRYNIIGQFEDEMVDSAADLSKNWWALEYITHDDMTTEFRFRVWDESSNSFIADVYYPVVLDWGSYVNHVKSNDDPDYIHIAVVRQNNEVRLFINGDYVASSTGAISDWDTITSAFQINGQQAYYIEDYPYSTTAISEMRILNYALYWDEFAPPESFTQLSGIFVMPRVFGVLINGNPGDVTGTFTILPRFSATLYNSPYMGDYGSAGYPHRIDIVKPELNIEITGLVEIFGQTSDGPLEKPPLQIDVTGYVGFSGSMHLTLPNREALLSGQISEIGTFYVSLPSRLPEWDGIYNPTGTINLTVPKKISLAGVFSEIGTINVYIPSKYITTADAFGERGTSGLTLPSLRALFTGYSSISGTMGIDIPMLQLILEFAPTSYINLVLNIRSMGLTQYSNYGFNSMCRFNNKHFGANGTAIYDLDEGETDDGTFIKWNFRSGYIDLEQKQKKKLKQVWMSYKSNGDLMITVVLPDGTEYEYELDEIYEEETGLRLKFGKGIRSKYVAIDVRNTDGSDITLDAMKIMMDKAGPAR